MVSDGHDPGYARRPAVGFDGYATGQPAIVKRSFSPIKPGHVFGINKALLWVGDGDNTIWGDDLSELYVNVLEYPTPEPSSIALATVGLVGLAAYRLRRRK